MSVLKSGLKKIKDEGLTNTSFRLGKVVTLRLLEAIDELKFRTMGNKKEFIKKIDNYKLHLDLKDKGIARELFFHPIREPYAFETVKSTLKKGNVVFDIGSNIGFYALLESGLVGESGKVYAIEPVPGNLELLKRNVELNKSKNIIILKNAVGDKVTKSEIYLSPKSNICSMIKNSRGITEKSVEVSVTTVDMLVKKFGVPNLIRMDVEGYEYNIIKGMKKTLENDKPLSVLMEMHPNIMTKEQTIWILETFRDNGFKAKKVMFEPPGVSLSKRGVNPLIKFFTNQIGENIGYWNVSIDGIIKKFEKRGSCIHVLFSR